MTKGLGEQEPETAPQVVQAYYESQYRRIGQLEEHGLHTSAFVITLTVGAFAFGYRLETPEDVRNIVFAVILGTNLAAAVYVWRVLCGQGIHARRAKAVLQQHASRLFKVEEDIQHRFLLGWRLRPGTQITIHIMLGVFAAYFLLWPPVLPEDFTAGALNQTQAPEPKPPLVLPPTTLYQPTVVCATEEWCVAIDSYGDLYYGNPRFGNAFFMKKVNIVRDKLGPRSWSLSCPRPDYCFAMDSFGNYYSGATRDGQPDGFQRRGP